MIALLLTVPVACWRKGHAREFLETEPLPPPATCYGALLSLVGEVDRERHRGCRITAGVLLGGGGRPPEVSVVLRTLWQIKKGAEPQGNGQNAGPDFQQLVTGAEVMIWCDSAEEAGPGSLEARVERALMSPGDLERFGGWSLGESTHLINDVWLLRDGAPPRPCRLFIADPAGDVTLPIWVDHVGTAGTRYAVGRIVEQEVAPRREQLPQVPAG